jgi:hypothetical protein
MHIGLPKKQKSILELVENHFHFPEVPVTVRLNNSVTYAMTFLYTFFYRRKSALSGEREFILNMPG